MFGKITFNYDLSLEIQVFGGMGLLLFVVRCITSGDRKGCDLFVSKETCTTSAPVLVIHFELGTTFDILRLAQYCAVVWGHFVPQGGHKSHHVATLTKGAFSGLPFAWMHISNLT